MCTNDSNMSSSKDYCSLVCGTESLDFSGDAVPCKLLITGDTAFPVLVTPKRDVLIAASRYGKGKVVVLAHEHYLDIATSMVFLKNAVSWLSPHPGSIIGVKSTFDLLANILRASGRNVQIGNLTPGLGVLCIDGYDESQAREIITFVREGGGLLIGAQAWHWSYSHKENVLNHFPGNKIASVSGVYFTSDYGENGTFTLTKNQPRTPIFTNVNFSEDLKLLLNGVSYLDINGDSYPSDLLLHGVLTFPVGLTDNNGCFLGGAYYGKGRVVVISHEYFLYKPELKTIILNAISWLDINQKQIIGVRTDMQYVKEFLERENVPCQLTNLVPGLSVYCCDSYSNTEADAIHQFVAEGGGLLIGGQSWYWSSINEDDDVVSDYPGNKILNKFGITILDRTVNRGSYKAISPEEANEQYHFPRALCKLQDELKSSDELKPPLSTWVVKLREDLPAFMRLPASPITSSIQNQFIEIVQMCVPNVSKENPVSSSSKQGLLLSLADECCTVSQAFDDSDIPPPFIVEIDTSNTVTQSWRSTGLYLAPRNTAMLEFPLSAVVHGIQVQVGCQSDDLSSKEMLSRAPVVVQKMKVIHQKVSISCFWGGLIYIVLNENCNLGVIPVKVHGAEPVPTFINGKSSHESWLQRTRHLPAPWAELITDNIILTVCSDAIRSLDDPEELLSFWDKVMVAVAELAAIPTKFPRPERIVTDVQISAGWMHSGYPIMCYFDSVKELADLNFIRTEGFWGPLHELGHNQQKSNWNFTGTGEATNNLWPLYVHEKLLGMPPERAHPALKPEERAERIREYLRKGSKLENWNVFTALETYLQLKEGFGWEPFKRVFKEYQSITNVKDDDTFKMNLWVEKFSNAVETNLVLFFQEWGWPIEDSTRDKLSALPVWEDDPMKPYIAAMK
ncbi:hypothetical protein GDO86_006085 [Hymenochirus boettgeri]|uniref:Peptidase M60 domain-containing protein n=1 Tax=Hymenochirus boettgeri TaxID=247094 RepID=A0A8T2J4K7_9PIPI|nr:hypothetical protein GDO86_006085 [Hymenochirus boettgeri]